MSQGLGLLMTDVHRLARESQFECDHPVWEHNLDKGLRLDRGVRPHLIVTPKARP